MKKLILNISKIIIAIITIPLWFLGFYHGVGHMPNVDTGKIEEVHFYHSMYEILNSLELSFIFYLFIVVVIVSIVLSTISIKSNNKKIYKISNIVLIITIILFLVCLTVGSTVSRGY